MKFKKKSKTAAVVPLAFTVVVCAGFLATGAYATPAANHNNMITWKEVEIQNDVLTEDGVYYIFCDGAEENDKPQSSVSAGSIKFVLVRKDGYTSIGPFSNMKTLMKDVANQCEYMKTLTREEKELVIKTAADIYGTAESDRNIKEIENKTERTEKQYSTEYAQYGITVTDGIYYYQGERVRIFMDLRMSGSFENFVFDHEGSVDLRVLRDKNNFITDMEYLTKSEADELLYNMDKYSPDNQLEIPLEKENDSLDNSDNHLDMPLKDQNIGRSVRVTKEELTDELRDIIKSCDTDTWYVIKSNGYQYIYFGGLPYNYTFQPEIYNDRNSGTINIFDMGTSIGNYVLLEIQQNVPITIYYNGTQISYTEL